MASFVRISHKVRNGCNDRGPWVTKFFPNEVSRTTDSFSVLQTGTKRFQDPLLRSGNILPYGPVCTKILPLYMLVFRHYASLHRPYPA